jgi:DNA helicase-2/ATP-dependent DNA helicase PcrA
VQRGGRDRWGARQERYLSPQALSLATVTPPGPIELGRSVVIGPDSPAPSPWKEAERFSIDPSNFSDPARLESLVMDLARRHFKRVPSVFTLGVDVDELNKAESIEAPPYELGAGFSFLKERLVKLVWHNSYDARSGSMIWWWAHKAIARLEGQVGGPADVVLDDGIPVWIDGGPRQPLDLEYQVIHHQSIDVGRPTTVRSLIPPREDDLAPDQLEAVSHLVGPARVVAPAGSGKTRVLTARVRHLLEDRDIEPEILTALAYNRRAAEEMVSRLPEGEALNVRTIHSIGWEILRMAEPHLRLISEREQRRRLEPITMAPPRPNTDVIGPYIEALDEVRIGLRTPEDVEAGRDDVPGFVETFRRYRDRLSRAGEADHAEQIYGAIEALLRIPDLRSHWQSRCRHLLVDEFQDLTPAYLLLIRLLASPEMNVFGVGDDDQVIYGYAGADPGYLIDFEQLFPGAGFHALEVNYRSPGDVVDAAVNLVSYNQRRVEKTIEPASDLSGLEVLASAGGDLAVSATNRILRLLDDGVEPNSIAVLARVNSALMPVHVALADRGIPFESLLTDEVLNRTLMRAALAWIRIALEPTMMRRNDLFEAVRRPSRGITRLLSEMVGRRRGPFSLSGLIEMGADLEGRRSNRWNGFCEDILLASRAVGTTPELLEVLSSEVGLDKAAAALDAGRSRADRSAQSDDLTALRRVAALGPGPEEFEAWLRERLTTDPSPNGVTLSTVHRVKGLEWDHVVVFGVDRGAMPHELADDIEEERRVFHVAITRGRKSITVLADEDRPSRFLTEIDGTAPRPTQAPRSDGSGRVRDDGVHVSVGDRLTVSGGYQGNVLEILTTGVLIEVAGSGATMAVPWGERVSKSGDQGRLSPGEAPADPDLAQRLRAWRLEQAMSQGVPAYVVFNDRTLESLASMRPSTAPALLEVPGIGPAKLEAYGDDLLDLIARD